MLIQSSTPFKGEAESAWNKLMDFRSYTHWNPFVVQAKTYDRRNVELLLDPSPEDRMVSLNLSIDRTKAPHFLRGALKYGVPGLLNGRYQLAIEDGMLKQEVKLGGLLRRFYVSEYFGRQVKRGLDAMGAALAKSCA